MWKQTTFLLTFSAFFVTYFLMSRLVNNEDKIANNYIMPVALNTITVSTTVRKTEQNDKEDESLKTKIVDSQTMGGRPKPAINYEKAYKEICKNSWEEDYTKLHKYLLQTNQKRFVVYYCGAGGWGNHIRNLITSFHVAVISKRAFINECSNPIPLDVYLKPRNIEWNFKINHTGLTERGSYGFKKEEIKNFSDSKCYEEKLTYEVEYLPRFLSFGHLVLRKLIKYNYSKAIRFPFHLNGCNFYYLFKKSDPLQKRLDEWKEKLGFNDNIVFGIHVREGNAVMLNGTRDLFDVRMNGTKDYELLFDCAKQIHKKIEEKYDTKKIIWFLAADTERMRNYAKKNYGDKVRHINGPIENIGVSRKGNEDAGMLTMFLDYFLLQESDYRLYTSESSFDTAIDYITFGRHNAGRVYLYKFKYRCALPTTLLQ